MRAQILKRGPIAAIFAKPWAPQPIDLTKPGSGHSPEERRAAIAAGRIIAGEPVGRVLDLASYRQRGGRYAG